MTTTSHDLRVARTHPAGRAALHAARLTRQLAIADLAGAPGWTRLLDVAARHPGRGVDDLLLIARQRPDATDLGTYDQWRARGAHVRRGERAVALLQPLDEGGFDVVRVFDVTQTDAMPAPHRPAYDLVRVVSALAALADGVGLAVRLGRGLATAAHVDGDRLDLAAHLPLSAAAGHLVHHLARRLLPAGPVRDVQAAGVAHVVARRFGLQPPGVAAPESRHRAAPSVPSTPDEAVATVSVITGLSDAFTDRLEHALERRSAAPPAPAPKRRNPRTAAQRRRARAADAASDAAPVDRAALYAANAAAAEFYAAQLPVSHPAAAYLRSRGIAAAAPRSDWQLGVAPAGGDVLLRHLRARGFTDQVLLAAGLVAAGRLDGGLYDLFRDRLVFPVHAPDGQVAGFTGRDLSGRSPAKYFNTPETAVFHKGRLLFGLAPQTLGQGPPDRFVVVEGPTDAIAAQLIYRELEVEGVRSVVVASCGTAFTRAQFALLDRLSGPDTALVISFDADAPGAKALDRAYPLAVTWAHGPVSGTGPTGFKDVSELLAAREPGDALLDLLAAERPLPVLGVGHALARAFPERFNAAWPEDRVRAFRAVAPYLLDAVGQDQVELVVQAAAERLGLAPHEISEGVVAHFATERD
ncbi:toprim domain-containing protein [Catellatospora vulcania]|uniref:toprim domain-containing protein n=1 Tax=Catellatospora vulcania TaxID=1460450 RepID=UPI0012D4A410|nr:toprim domain-containing protein [Catellatospora vulcania]